MGFGYGFGNLGKFIGPAGLAVIAGSDNFVTPKATLSALIPAMNYFAFWYLVGAAAIWFIGLVPSRRRRHLVYRLRDEGPHDFGNR
jgi:putative MFS transporter